MVKECIRLQCGLANQSSVFTVDLINIVNTVADVAILSVIIVITESSTFALIGFCLPFLPRDAGFLSN